jgi:hypothetical protein
MAAYWKGGTGTPCKMMPRYGHFVGQLHASAVDEVVDDWTVCSSLHTADADGRSIQCICYKKAHISLYSI